MQFTINEILTFSADQFFRKLPESFKLEELLPDKATTGTYYEVKDKIDQLYKKKLLTQGAGYYRKKSLVRVENKFKDELGIFLENWKMLASKKELNTVIYQILCIIYDHINNKHNSLSNADEEEKLYSILSILPQSKN